MSVKDNIRGAAVVLTDGLLSGNFAKTAHALLRGSDRFTVVAVVDRKSAGRDAGEVMDGKALGIPVFAGVGEMLEAWRGPLPPYLVVGVAFPGGRLPATARGEIAAAVRAGMSVVSGLHQFVSDDPELKSLAMSKGVELIDVRRPRPVGELHFWDGSIYSVRAPRVAILGTDCAIGKRTTCWMLTLACREAGLAAAMVYTGQTGWMLGVPHGFILDATPNDFVSGELEHAVVACDRETSPELILIEGQSSLRNPSGPCGSELLLSAATTAVILQHAPGRRFFKGQEKTGLKLPPVSEEIALIESYGAPVLALTLKEEALADEEMARAREQLAEELGRPVVRPLREGVGSLVPLLRKVAGRE